MDYRLLGFFSGFYNRSFPNEIAERLREGLLKHDSFICVSAWPIVAQFSYKEILLTATEPLSRGACKTHPTLTARFPGTL